MKGENMLERQILLTANQNATNISVTSYQGTLGGWSPSQLRLGKRQLTPCTGHSIRGFTQIQAFTQLGVTSQLPVLVDFVRKPEQSEKINTGMERTCQLHKERDQTY